MINKKTNILAVVKVGKIRILRQKNMQNLLNPISSLRMMIHHIIIYQNVYCDEMYKIKHTKYIKTTKYKI